MEKSFSVGPTPKRRTSKADGFMSDSYSGRVLLFNATEPVPLWRDGCGCERTTKPDRYELLLCERHTKEWRQRGGRA